MTLADKIRSMTDEELAVYLRDFDIIDVEFEYCTTLCSSRINNRCVHSECIKDVKTTITEYLQRDA